MARNLHVHDRRRFPEGVSVHRIHCLCSKPKSCVGAALSAPRAGYAQAPFLRNPLPAQTTAPTRLPSLHTFQITPHCEARPPAGAACLPHTGRPETALRPVHPGSPSAARHRIRWPASSCEVRTSVWRWPAEYPRRLPGASDPRAPDWDGARCTTSRKRRDRAASTGAAAEPEYASYTRSS